MKNSAFLLLFLLSGNVIADDLSPAQLVNPFIGTDVSNVTGESVPGGKGGATQPAAVVPFGMVQIGPDTDKPETSGYNFANKSIKAFSLTHMSGPGCRNSGEIAFMPVTGEKSWPAPSENTFIKANESSSPGYYQVRFDHGTQVELTATERTGMARLTSPIVARKKSASSSTPESTVPSRPPEILFSRARALSAEK